MSDFKPGENIMLNNKIFIGDIKEPCIPGNISGFFKGGG